MRLYDFSGHVTSCENAIQDLRSQLAKATEASGERIADLGRIMAEKEAALRVYKTLQEADEEQLQVLNVFIDGLRLDDTWSGRGNDVRRAMFAAELKAIHECKKILNCVGKRLAA